MTKFASIALSAILLLAGAAVAEPPNPAALDGAPVVHDPGVRQLAEADLADVVGAAFRHDACTAGLRIAGGILFVAGWLSANRVLQVGGRVLQHLKCV